MCRYEVVKVFGAVLVHRYVVKVFGVVLVCHYAAVRVFITVLVCF